MHGPVDLPDTPARAFLDDSGATVLVAVDSTSRLSRGPSLFSLTRDCAIVLNSTLSPDPALYATDDGFLDATHSFGTVIKQIRPHRTPRGCGFLF